MPLLLVLEDKYFITLCGPDWCQMDKYEANNTFTIQNSFKKFVICLGKLKVIKANISGISGMMNRCSL